MEEVKNTPVEENVESTSITSSIFNFLYKNLIFILICVVLGGFLGFGANRLFHKPVYTASLKVMFITNITDTSSEGNVGTADVSLAKLYLPETARLIKSADFAFAATQIYQDEYDVNGTIDTEKINVEYNEKILIFTITYKDYSEQEAINKLKSVKRSAEENLPKSVQAKDVTIKATQSEDSITAVRNSQTVLYVIAGVVVGLILALVKVFISYSLDNSIKSKEELERLTGASLIAVIDNRDNMNDKK